MAHDVVIIGAGPAGMQAAIAASSEGLDVLVIEKEDRVGGMIGQTPKLENAAFCGAGLTGPEFANSMQRTAEKMGTKFITGDVVALTLQRNGEKKIAVNNSSAGPIYTAHTVVLAVGTRWVVPNIPGLHDPAVHWGPRLTTSSNHWRDVAVYGGGPAAAQAALALADNSHSVTVHIIVRSYLSAPQYLIDRIKSHPKIKVHEGTKIVAVKPYGLDALNLLVHDGGLSISGRIVNALFMCNGTTPNTEWVPKEIQKDRDGRLLVGIDVENPNFESADTMETSMPGVFAVGDCRSGSVPRVGVALGDGSMAVSNIWAYFRKNPVCRRCSEVFRK